MNLRSQKQLAARILKCGLSRVRVKTEKDVGEAITREDIRNLIGKGLIWKVQKRGQNRAMARKRLGQKRRGRKRGFGSKKGKAGARSPGKTQWMKTIRSVRDSLKKLKESGMIERRLYRKLYLMAKGGSFKSRRHLLSYLRDHELIKKKPPKEKIKKPEKIEKPIKKTTKKAKTKPKKTTGMK